MTFAFYLDPEMTQTVGSTDATGQGLPPLFHHNFIDNHTHAWTWYFGSPDTSKKLFSGSTDTTLALTISDNVQDGIVKISADNRQNISYSNYSKITIKYNGFLYKIISWNWGFSHDDFQTDWTQTQNNQQTLPSFTQIQCLGKAHEPSEITLSLSGSNNGSQRLDLNQHTLNGGSAIAIDFKWQNAVSDNHFRPNLPQISIDLDGDYLEMDSSS